MNKAGRVIYLDSTGAEHDALVVANNPLNPGRSTLVFVDPKADEAFNLDKKFDVPHMSSITEMNSDLPTYHLNCWKEVGEASRALPEDHQALDAPFAGPKVDEAGKVVPSNRPLTDAVNVAHQAGVPLPAPADKDKTIADMSKGIGILRQQLAEKDRELAQLKSLPSATDLDKVAEEVKTKEATSKKK